MKINLYINDSVAGDSHKIQNKFSEFKKRFVVFLCNNNSKVNNFKIFEDF